MVELKIGSGPLKNMAARGGAVKKFPYMAIEKPCEHFRSQNVCLIIMKLGQNIGFIYILDEFENGPDQWKNMAAKGRGSFPYVFS